MLTVALQLLICCVAGYVAVTSSLTFLRSKGSLPRIPVTRGDLIAASLAPSILILMAVINFSVRDDRFFLWMGASIVVGAGIAAARALWYLRAAVRRHRQPSGW